MIQNNHPYLKILNRFDRALEVPYVSVAGSTGSMGGSISHEFQFPAEIGQDRLLVCPECERGTNVEVLDQKTMPGYLYNSSKVLPSIEESHETFLPTWIS